MIGLLCFALAVLASPFKSTSQQIRRQMGCTSNKRRHFLGMRLRATSSAIGTGSMAASSRADCAPWASGKAAGKKEIALSPIAIEVVRRIDALFEIERTINGKSAEGRLAVRQTLSRPLTED